MFQRKISLPKSHSFLLFGGRGTGKTTLLKTFFPESNTYYLDLLDLTVESELIKDPERLSHIIDGFPKKTKRLVIDEIQKIPKLLDVVHRKIEEKKRANESFQFIMTGSSARKLKRGSANLLAGRAFVYHLFPFNHTELSNEFDLETALNFGMLPEVWNLKNKELKMRFLEAYGKTYIKEEVWNEQIIRKLEPFSNFVEIAAQMNGKILNFSKIARDIHADIKTVQSYYQILEDTLLGFIIPPYHKSIRKRQTTNPKFYFFDTGVKKALDNTISIPLTPKSYEYGNFFEHFILLEMIKANEYKKKNYRFFYFMTHDGAEIDFIIERPGKPLALVEIKSTQTVDKSMTKHLNTFVEEIKPSESFLLSQDKTSQKMGKTKALHWIDGLKAIGL